MSYFKNGTSAEVLEENNNYPFGLKHEGYNPTAGNNSYQYKYNGKELQTESGMLDYGWRQYMPELGRWNGMDQLAEIYNSVSPYAYVGNNPIMMFDPDGRKMSGTNGNDPDKDGNLDPDQLGGVNNPYLIEEVVIQGKKKSSKGAKPDIMMPLNCMVCYSGAGTTLPAFPSISTGVNSNMIMATGVLTLPAASGAGTWTGIRGVLGEIAGGLRASLWTLPLMLNGDSSFHANSKPITIPADIPVTTTGEPDPTIILYRGVSSRIFHNDSSQYMNAHLGIAIPKGYYQVSTLFGPHADMEAHAGGDNYSIWTSWTSDKEVARNFANGIAFGKAVPGIIMSKTFKVGQAVPNPFTLGESEWLVPGVTYGAKVEYVLPRPGY